MKLEGDGQFLFFTMMQAAIRMKKMGLGEKDYLNFAKGIWESLELNDIEQLEQTIFDGMMKDLKDFVKK